MDIRFESFKKAFSSDEGLRHVFCCCGKQYHDPYDMHMGETELEFLEEDGVSLSVLPNEGLFTISFEGKTYASACNCWHERAEKIMGFLDTHHSQIASYLNFERKRRIESALSITEVSV